MKAESNWLIHVKPVENLLELLSGVARDCHLRPSHRSCVNRPFGNCCACADVNHRILVKLYKVSIQFIPPCRMVGLKTKICFVFRLIYVQIYRGNSSDMLKSASSHLLPNGISKYSSP